MKCKLLVDIFRIQQFSVGKKIKYLPAQNIYQQYFQIYVNLFEIQRKIYNSQY